MHRVDCSIKQHIRSVKVMASRVSNLETSAWQQRSIVRSNLGNIVGSHRSNAIWLVTTEGSKPCDTVSFVKMTTTLEEMLQLHDDTTS